MAAPPIKNYSMSDIKSKLLQPALTSHFVCQFTPPPSVTQFLNTRAGAGFVGARWPENQEMIEISCTEASLPGSSLATNEINNDFSGVTERHAYRRLYDDRADFTFYVDTEYRVIDFFENWISYIVGEDTLTGQGDKTYNYRVNYPKNYITQNLYITKFEKNHSGRILEYKFVNAYPISINSMPVSYDSSQLLKCTVSFTYSRYVIDRRFGKFERTNNSNNIVAPNEIPQGSRIVASRDIGGGLREIDYLTSDGKILTTRDTIY